MRNIRTLYVSGRDRSAALRTAECMKACCPDGMQVKVLTRPDLREDQPCGPGLRENQPCEPGLRENQPCGQGLREDQPFGSDLQEMDHSCAILFQPSEAWNPEAGQQGSWKEFLEDADTLEQLVRSCRPDVLIFLSDFCVYGKVFGTEHRLQEEELGYLNPLLYEEDAALVLRLTEDLCVRLSRETETAVMVARTTLADMPEVLWADLWNMVYAGEGGEIYNMDGIPLGEGPVSPLSPLPLQPDTTRIRKLRAREKQGTELK